MRQYVNRDTRKLIRSFTNPEGLTGPTGSNSILGKRGDTDSREILFGRPYTGAEEIDATVAITSFKYGLKLLTDLAGDYLVSNWDEDEEEFVYTKSGAQRFTDAVTNSTATITSATAAFTAADVGLTVTGSGIPAGATILTINSSTSVVLSKDATATATGVTITIGRTPTYTVWPNYKSEALSDALVDGDISETVADPTARLALEDLDEGTIVKQTTPFSYWQLVDADKIDEDDGWAPAPQKPYIDLAGEIEVTQGDTVTSTALFTERVENDLNRGGEGVPGTSNPDYAALLALKAPLASPVFTGEPTAPTPDSEDDSERLATTAFTQDVVAAAITQLLNGAPGALDTLNELAAALGDDENFAAVVTAALADLDTALAGKVDTAGDASDLTIEGGAFRLGDLLAGGVISSAASLVGPSDTSIVPGTVDAEPGFISNAPLKVPTLIVDDGETTCSIIGGIIRGRADQLDFSDLPTSDPMIEGRLWSDGGTIKLASIP